MKTHALTGLLLTACLTAAAPGALAAPPATQPEPAAPAIQSRTLEGAPFRLSALKGKVVLVMFWNTDCAVCRDKMPELRQNYEGWKGQPFELVLVSTDRRKEDVQAYEKIIARVVAKEQRFPQLWTGEPGYQDNFGAQTMLPATYVIDKAGRIVLRFHGRIPAEAWDKISDLL
ncbi:peroxiredoxin [Caenimonas koreensis]|uniref:Redoxin domain-containing protein n=1 Tax=Caenimonas koreensis DSM 17982 TaxID=1121255 RepID=A0A844AUL8_9BURK|nr:TlpA disulfide reductase family protein [Caenimonas koreensis]MRD48200.1 redoxin domain-containing protein [Caenimonas koreensis DSM 17982]